ncbi:MAG: hypothetical protein KAQ75_13030 [Bacteroidales bacterium]|nr:hypothetical protein [Bacteroidales bacterium]
MNFRDQLLAELSKRNTDYIASVIDRNEKLFKQIFDLIIANEEYVSGRAAWVVETCWLKYPEMIEPYINDMIDFLPKTKYDNQRRHFTKILSTIDLRKLDEDRLGILIDRCFTWLEDPIYPTAVKMFSMQIIYNYVEIEPALASELIAIIENQFEDSTPGFKNRGEKTLKKLYKLVD